MESVNRTNSALELNLVSPNLTVLSVVVFSYTIFIRLPERYHIVLFENRISVYHMKAKLRERRRRLANCACRFCCEVQKSGCGNSKGVLRKRWKNLICVSAKAEASGGAVD